MSLDFAFVTHNQTPRAAGRPSDGLPKALGKGQIDVRTQITKVALFLLLASGALFAFAAPVAGASDAEVKFGGRAMFDFNLLDGDDDIGPLPDGQEARRLRLAASGTVYQNIEFKLQFDFAGSKVSYKDMYMGLKTPFMGIRVGQQHVPFGLEIQTSSNYITFIERSQTAGFAPDRQSGLKFFRTLGDDRGSIAVMAFQEGSSDLATKDEGYWSGAGRVSFVPWGGNDEGGLLHLGAAVAMRRNDVHEYGVELAPEAHLAPAFGDYDLPADSWTQLGAEAALVQGPFSVQAEFVTAMTSAPDGAEDATVNSWYAQASWWATGEKRAYKASSGTFDRVKPNSNYDGEEGWGALELAARYSMSDADDDAIMGGTLSALTVGANWHLNPKARVMLNYVRSEGKDTADLEGVINAILARFQVDF